MSILRMPAVKAETGYRSHASIYAAIHAGLMTMPVSLGPRAVGWPAGEVKVILQARIAGKTNDDIRKLVQQLHQDRVAGTGEEFKPAWLERSAAHVALAASRKPRGSNGDHKAE